MSYEKKLLFIFLPILIGTLSFFIYSFPKEKTLKINNMEKIQEQEYIREPAVAGSFYPGEKEILEKEIKRLLEKTKKIKLEKEIFGIIVPHAGYQFSGEVAGASFKQLEGEKFETVILIGNSHSQFFDGISLWPRGKYLTPLGEIEIDSEIAEKLQNFSQKIFFKKEAHLKEHSLEVQLPFLQIVLKRNFKIVPLLFGNYKGENYKILGDALLNIFKSSSKKILIVVSSDLSHYPDYQTANYLDKKVLNSILTGKVENFEKTLEQLEKENLPNVMTLACGEDAIKTLLYLSEKLTKVQIKLLKYLNSGDTSRDYSRVVGYGALIFLKEKTKQEFPFSISEEDKKLLLTIAKKSVENYLKERKIPDFQITSPVLNQKLGAFVTIKKDGKLRGCIGQILPSKDPLYKVVAEMAVSAAFSDLRFLPVKEEELPYLEYEISVLTEPKKIKDISEIVLGRDGVIIKKGINQGVFLPQVAIETGWSLEEFLSELCSQKAHLSPDCWKDKETEIYIFQALIISEK